MSEKEKIDLYESLIEKTEDELTDLEAELIYILAKDPVIQNLIADVQLD